MARLIKGAFVEDLAISTGKLAQGAVTAEKITAGSIISTKIGNGAVITARLADDAVTNDKLAANSVDSDQYVDASIDNAHLSADCVSADKLKIAYGDSIRLVNSGGSTVGISIDSDGDLVGPDTNKIASQNYVSTAVANLVDSSPDSLNTLNELAAALGDDANFSTTITSLIGTGFTGSGLGTDGQYTAPSGTNYLGSSSSLLNASVTLDSSIKSVETSLTSSISTNVSALETKINTVEASSGLQADGSFSISGTNYADSATSLLGAIEDVDGQVKTNADAIASNDTDIATNASAISSNTSNISSQSSLLDTHEASIGLNANGSFSAPSGTNYLGSVTSVLGASVALDTALNTVATNATRSLNQTKEQELVVITSTHISNNTVSFELDELSRHDGSVCVQYGNLILINGASYDFTIASDASTQKTTVTLSDDYKQSGSKALVAGDVLVFRYDHDPSFTYSE